MAKVELGELVYCFFWGSLIFRSGDHEHVYKKNFLGDVSKKEIESALSDLADQRWELMGDREGTGLLGAPTRVYNLKRVTNL